MTIQNRLLGAIYITIVGFLAGTAAAQEPLRIGVEGAYPPFSIKNADGTLTGFDIEMAWALCEQMNRECELVESDWDGIIPALLAKKFDAIIASMGITPERMKRVDFTNKYYISASALIIPKGGDVTASQAGTAGKTLGIQRATAHACYYENHFVDADVKQYPTTEEVYLDLENGRLDSILVDTLPALEWLKQEGRDERFEMVADDLYDVECFGEGIGIAVRKDEEDLRSALNTAIKELRANGVYASINDKYFDVDIYGADN